LAKASTLSTPEPPAGVDFSRFKIPPCWIPSDDCEVHVGRVIDVDAGEIIDPGTAYAVHAGEGIWAIPATRMAAWAAFGDLVSTMQSMGADDQNTMATLGLISTRLDEITTSLSRSIVSWTWTDDERKPLPQPYKNVAVFAALDFEEIAYLLSALQGETRGARKNGSVTSDAGSTD